MCGGDKDCVTGVSPLANEEPLVVMKLGINVMWEVIGEDGCNSCNGMVGKGKAPLCHGRDRRVNKRSSGAED